MDVENDDAFGAWRGLAEGAARLALGLAGMANIAGVIDLVSILAGSAGTQDRLLKSIKHDTSLLRVQDFAAAKENLAEAYAVGADSLRCRSHLDEAVKLLIRARGVADTLEERSLVEFYLAVVLYVIGDTHSARRWADRGRTSAADALESLLDVARTGPNVFPKIVDARPPATFPRHWSVWREVTAALNLAMSVPVFSIPSYPVYVALSRKRDKQIDKVRQYLPLYNTVLLWAANLDGTSPPDPLLLRQENLPMGASYEDIGIKETKHYPKVFVVVHRSDKSYRGRLRTLPLAR